MVYSFDTSDPDGQPSIPPSNSNSTAITWNRPTCNLLTSQELSSTLTPTDIDQNIINDCSLCASVAVCIQHHQRFNSTVCIHPPLLERCATFCTMPRSLSPRFICQLAFLHMRMTHILTHLSTKLLCSSLIPGNQPGRFDLKAYLNGDCRRVCMLSNQWTTAVTVFLNLLRHITDT